jgi:glycosyltransferase involved in cell wall biosynthesis
MKVLLCHFSFATIGGAERVALNIAQYLHTVLGASVDILCFDAPDRDKIGRQFGTDFGNGIKFVELNAPFGTQLQLIRIAHVHREARKIARNYDLCLSTYNEQDFGFRAIQYVHHPIFESREILRTYRIIPRENIIDRIPLLERFYYSALNVYSGTSRVRRRSNITLTNSEFMSGILKQCGYTDLQVLYPGFLDDSTEKVSISEKKHQIFSLGRIEPDKHTLELVDLYAALHREDPSLRLIICGMSSSEDYLSEVKNRIRTLGIPIELHLNKPRNEVLELVRESAWYINPKPFEHFGIASVEAIQAGCIPLLHDSGGNKELMPFEDLRFKDAESLTEVYSKLHNSETLKDSVTKALEQRSTLYSSSAFFELFHEIVRLYLIDKGTEIGPYTEAHFS